MLGSATWTCLRCFSRSVRLAQSSRIIPVSRRYSSAVTPKEAELSPILLNRARALAAEHATLTAQQAESFERAAAKRIGEIAPVANALKDWDTAHESITELQGLIDEPSTDTELKSLAEDDITTTIGTLSSLSATLKRALIPRHPFADMPCLIEIRPGAGGDEAGLFAAEMLRMYTSFCSSRGLRTTIIKMEAEDGVGAGAEERLSEVVMEVETPGSYNILRTEAGVHRVQRVPATEAKGRTHTSAVSVMILPSFPENNQEDSPLNFDDPNSDYYVNPQDVQSEKFRASGAGGQHVNKTESAVRLTHIPTGTVISMQDSRSQHENRRKAWLLLRAKLAQARREAREQEMMELRRGAMGGVNKTGRGDKIRTYNFTQSRCTDHRSGMTVHNIGKVMDGGENLEKIMESVQSWLVDQEVEALCLEQQAATAEARSPRKATA
ncbi:peptide chain release factor 1 [Trichophyton violaceum]|uniref:Peptide chain release factor 1 n=1 Tax=Trichophyton violaceum TaxID=34388 RepID=A0A178FJN7_TRIVO|nr:peptide chain release factor 1 [Trichophyton violaceum]